jgi:hypothetical protein
MCLQYPILRNRGGSSLSCPSPFGSGSHALLHFKYQTANDVNATERRTRQSGKDDSNRHRSTRKASAEHQDSIRGAPGRHPWSNRKPIREHDQDTTEARRRHNEGATGGTTNAPRRPTEGTTNAPTGGAAKTFRRRYRRRLRAHHEGEDQGHAEAGDRDSSGALGRLQNNRYCATSTRTGERQSHVGDRSVTECKPEMRYRVLQGVTRSHFEDVFDRSIGRSEGRKSRVTITHVVPALPRVPYPGRDVSRK